jgi:hypothetical protein
VKPDALFGIGYGNDHKFFALEFDRSTEDVEPAKNLERASWLRKIFFNSACAIKPKPIYETCLHTRTNRHGLGAADSHSTQQPNPSGWKGFFSCGP